MQNARSKDLFAFHPGKHAWRRQRSQASDFGRLGLRCMPGDRVAWQGTKQTGPKCMLRLAMPRSPFNRAVAEIVLIFSSLFRQMIDGSVSVLRSFSLSTPDDLSKKNCATGRRCMGREVFRPREPSKHCYKPKKPGSGHRLHLHIWSGLSRPTTYPQRRPPRGWWSKPNQRKKSFLSPQL